MEKLNFTIREATQEDVALILDLIIELATYEKCDKLVTANEELLTKWLFEEKCARVWLGEYEGKPAGYALFFYSFSTFLGKAGIYLEDLYVKPEFRGKGLGKHFFSALTAHANEKGMGRVEWGCLNWNKPSIDFYMSLGAVPQSEWTKYRLSGETLENFNL